MELYIGHGPPKFLKTPYSLKKVGLVPSSNFFEKTPHAIENLKF